MNGHTFITLTYPFTISFTEGFFAFISPDNATGLLFGRNNQVSRIVKAPNRAIVLNTPCQCHCFNNKFPIVGAITGAIPEMITNRENTFVRCSFTNKSFTAARPTTTPAQPPKACRKRITHNCSIEVT